MKHDLVNNNKGYLRFFAVLFSFMLAGSCSVQEQPSPADNPQLGKFHPGITAIFDLFSIKDKNNNGRIELDERGNLSFDLYRYIDAYDKRIGNGFSASDMNARVGRIEQLSRFYPLYGFRYHNDHKCILVDGSFETLFLPIRKVYSLDQLRHFLQPLLGLASMDGMRGTFSFAKLADKELKKRAFQGDQQSIKRITDLQLPTLIAVGDIHDKVEHELLLYRIVSELVKSAPTNKKIVVFTESSSGSPLFGELQAQALLDDLARSQSISFARGLEHLNTARSSLRNKLQGINALGTNVANMNRLIDT